MTTNDKANLGCFILILLFFIIAGIIKLALLDWDIRCLFVECRIMK